MDSIDFTKLSQGPLRPTWQVRVTSTERANLNELTHIFRQKPQAIIRIALKYYYREVKGMKD